MLGLLVIIVISWVLLHFIEGKNINALGIVPNANHMIQFLIGILFIIPITLSMIFIESKVMTIDWELNSPIKYDLIFDSFIYHLRSALTEDLIFRGAILYILINRIGAKWAILISAICFGIYHVFSYGLSADRVILILYVILVTGFSGYVWAYTFHRTKSIMMPLGFHLGFNLVMTFFFASQPYGQLIFVEISRMGLSEWNELYFSLFKGLFPSIATLVFVKWLLRLELRIFQPGNN
ncbi:CPBP family intramembrane glutamic endopeptidase [Winogradskyella ursingii]|uniref:CPBP family intramembrane glutamic endopeptidase n=1 Tax=Winogradskyella ursingii TaxID=2686079 RepID=UPI0015C84F4A|nr:CPBP family intramembrane glutamic endopeptidase [Winogradskyella ursingii]